MKTGIIGALKEEVELYISCLENKKKHDVKGFSFHTGTISGHDVVVAESGAGKVNSAICAQLMISGFDVGAIIFTGVAGAINPNRQINDIVISKDSVQHDLDAKKLGFERGQVPFTDLRFFKASDELIKLASESAKDLDVNAVEGRILSGDQFVTSEKTVKDLRNEFDGECVDMETAAVAHVCGLNSVPYIAIRAISDRADHSAHVDFKEFCEGAAKNSFMLVKKMLSKMDKNEEKKIESLGIVKSMIRTIPNWPKKGVMFRDITTLLKDRGGFGHMIRLLVDRYKGIDVDYVAGIESRGFIVGAILADRLGLGFILLRKAGKLPGKTVFEEYELEYGKNRIEMHKDAIKKGDRILLVDDLIATGGTALAACRLIAKTGGKIIECTFIVDLPDLGGKKRLEEAGYKTFTLVEFEGE